MVLKAVWDSLLDTALTIFGQRERVIDRHRRSVD